MSRGNVGVLILVLIVLGIGTAGYLYMQKYLPKYKWDTGFNYESKEPYGTQILYDLLKSNQEVELIEGPLSEKLDSINVPATFFTIGEEFHADSVDRFALKKFIEVGNTAYVCTHYFPQRLMDFLLNDSISMNIHQDYKDSLVSVYFEEREDPLPFHYQVLKQKSKRIWGSYYEGFLRDSLNLLDLKVISRIDSGGVNCFSFGLGKGKVVIHAAPLFYSNYHLKTTAGFLHLELTQHELLNHKIYWENYVPRQRKSATGFTRSPLSYLLSQPSLRWAWYLSIVLVLLYVFVQSKRKQRVIPMVLPKRNSSIAYAKALGLLHYKSKKYYELGLEMMQHFWFDLRHRYHIYGKEKIEETELITLIAQKTDTEIVVIQKIIRYEKKIIKTRDFDVDDLMNLYNLLERYYKTQEKS